MSNDSVYEQGFYYDEQSGHYFPLFNPPLGEAWLVTVSGFIFCSISLILYLRVIYIIYRDKSGSFLNTFYTLVVHLAIPDCFYLFIQIIIGYGYPVPMIGFKNISHDFIAAMEFCVTSCWRAAAIIVLFIANSCNGGGTDQTKAGTVVERLVGNDVLVKGYDNSVYSGRQNGGPITQGSDLNCDFSTSCCWQNTPDSSLKWKLETGRPSIAKIKRNFGTSQLPDGHFLILPTEYSPRRTRSDSAKFISCSISCTTSPLSVSLRHWTTRGVTMKVCTQEVGSTVLQNCQTLSNTNDGTDTIQLPQVSRPASIVVVGSGFTGHDGSVTMMDDIQVNTNVCSGNVGPAGCTNVQCNFESSSACSYIDASSSGIGGANKGWQTVQGQFQNPATGVPGAGEGNYYSATYLYPNDVAALVTNVNMDQARVVRFLAYKVVQGVDLQACCDQIQICVYNTGKNTQVSDYKRWKTVSISCPAGTKQVIFYAKNFGSNQGAVGLDNIQMLIPSGSDPNTATQNVC